jgi:hypothetical protein
MNENPLLVGFELEENRSIIADNSDLREIKSTGERDDFWLVVDQVRLPAPSESTEVERK